MAESVRPLDVDDKQEQNSQSKMFIVKILSEMRSNFNKSSNESANESAPPEESQDREISKSFTNNEDSSSIIFEAQHVNDDEDNSETVNKEPIDETLPDEAKSPVDTSVEKDIVNPETTNQDGSSTVVEPPESEMKIVEEPQEAVATPEQQLSDDILPPEEPSAQPDPVECKEEPVPSDDVAMEAGTLPEEQLSTDDQKMEDVSNPQLDSKEDSGCSGNSNGNVEQLKRKSSVGQNSKIARVKHQDESIEKRPRRSLRSVEKAEQDLTVKRSSRRMSKDYNNRESVLQNAIALKEKSLISFSMEDKPRRSSRLSEESKVAPSGGGSSNRATPGSKAVKPNRLATAIEEDPNSTGEESVPSAITNRAMKHAVEAASDSTDVEDNSSQKRARLAHDLKSSATSSSQESSEDDRNGWPHASIPSPSRALSSCSADKGTRSTRTGDIIDDQNGSEPKLEEVFKNSIESPMGIVEIGSEAPDLPIVTESNDLLCECDIMTKMYAKPTTNQLCRALDLYENRLVKCANEIDDRPLLRTCKSKPYQALCRVHFERMIRHQACPTCGAFCTQALVNICEKRHLFHKDCELKVEDLLACPHCGTDKFTLYKIKLQNHQYPLFLPTTKPLNKLPVAKMSISRQAMTSVDVQEKEMPRELVVPMSLTLPNGRVITSEGISLPEQEKLVYLLQNATPSEEVRYNYRALYQAAKSGDAEKVLHILGSGLSPNQASMNPLLGAVKQNRLLVVHLLVQAGANLETLDKYQYTPLMLAVQCKRNEIVKYLIKAGANVAFKGADGMTALHIAAKEGNLEACHYILTLVKLPPNFIDTLDDGKWTALVWGAENCHSKVVRYLLEKNADPQIRDGEMNIALHWSAFAGSMEITEDLLNFGNSVNVSNVHGDTPLHIAARQAAESCVLLLLARGARTEVVNKAGQTPRDCVINKDSYCYSAIDLNMTIKTAVANTSLYPKILCNDISGGREENPIQCVNGVDDSGVPVDYTYITENCFTSNITMDRRISSLVCCKCEDRCVSASCMCTKISRGSWYDNNGKLVPEFNFEDPPMMFECNPACGCNILSCKNRLVQRGLKTRLQLCKTKDKSWGVITLKEIPKGTYVCEYVGEIISDLEADTRKDDSYLFDLDNAEGETYCLDARLYGNICRFINHSCRPNLSPVKIFYQHQDLHFPRIAMFASRDIAPNEELGFDYGEKFWMIKCKSFTCHCGESTCRYSESTIQQTLDKYQKKMKELEEMSDD